MVQPIRIIGDPDNQRPDKWRYAVLHTVKEEKTFIHTAKLRKEKRIGHILRRNYLLKHGKEGEVQGASSYVMTFRKRKDSVVRKRKH
jgi:hypothetical protein